MPAILSFRFIIRLGLLVSLRNLRSYYCAAVTEKSLVRMSYNSNGFDVKFRSTLPGGLIPPCLVPDRMHGHVGERGIRSCYTLHAVSVKHQC